MVVAGVFQVASLLPIYVQFGAQEQLHWIAWIAAFTAFYAAAVACAQRDIKRGLAFSTISQIAYMLVALGVCFYEKEHGSFYSAEYLHHGGLGYMAAMFHLFTHAMFKALLFLCSGAIIVIIGSNFKEYMGGLHKYMPITNICFLIGCLAIAGIPPFAGFFSKDEIISACNALPGVEGQALKWIMTLVAGMTAFYMFRLYYVIFWGESYYEQDPENRRRPQEVPFVMWGPLVFLAIISITAGWIPFGHFVSANGLSYDIHIDWSIATTSIIAAVIGMIPEGLYLLTTLALAISTVKLASKKEALKKAKEYLELVKLPTDIMERLPHQLSGGQLQRVVIARALTLSPEVLIYDEATAALDVSVQQDVLKLMYDLRKSCDNSVIFICHDLAAVRLVADRIIVMYNGKIVEIVESRNLLSESKEEYTKKLLGSVFEVK